MVICDMCSDKFYRSNQKALELAKHAASLSKEPYILDTLAEAYYANNDFNAAIETEEKALSSVKDNRPYYLNQLSKFKKTMEIENHK